MTSDIMLFNKKEKQKLKRQLKQKNEELKNCKEEKQIYRSSLDLIPEPLIMVGENYKIQFINQAASDFLGISTEEWIGERCDTFFVSNLEQVNKCPIRTAMMEKREVENEVESRFKGKHKSFLKLKGVPLIDQRGDVTGGIGLIRDITREKKTQKESNLMIDENPVPMMVLDGDGKIERANESMRYYFDLQGERLTGELVGENFDFLESFWNDIFGKKKEVLNEYKTFETEEEEKHFLISGIPLNSRIQGSKFLVIVEDISDKKKVEDEFEELQNRYEAVIENAPLSVCITDLDENLLYVNQHMADEFGYTVEELEGGNLLDLMPEEEHKKVREGTEERTEGERGSSELTSVTKDGTKMETLVSAAPFKGPGDDIDKTIGFIKDITELKEQRRTRKYLENQVERILSKLQKAERGNLDIRIEKEKDDEIGKLIEGINHMISNFRRDIEDIRMAAGELREASQVIATSSEKLNTTAENVAESVQEISKGIQEETKSAEELARKVEDGAANIEETSASANDIASSAEETAAKTDEGMEHAVKASEMVDDLQSILEETAEKATALGEQSDKIGEIIKTISDIADQTNLLALNASIEAARAGEQGKGFAVVADSVRELAEETQEETEHITKLINDTQENANKVVEDIKKVKAKSNEVDEVTHQNLDSLRAIKNSTDLVSKAIQEISQAVDEVADDLQEGALDVEKMVNIVNENSNLAESVAASTEEQNASVEELSSSAEQLASLADNLSKMVEEYKLG